MNQVEDCFIFVSIKKKKKRKPQKDVDLGNNLGV